MPCRLVGLLLICIFTVSVQRPAFAEGTLVAVAANFTATAQDLGSAFTDRTGHRVRFSFGSTGKLFAQIVHGAPFDAFLAADVARPERAEADGLAVSGTRFTYAVGQLVLFSRQPNLVDTVGAVLSSGQFPRLAIANPATAPYGAAAIETMRGLGVFDSLAAKIVQGDNVAQTLQFIMTGNVPLGFVALAQVVALERSGQAGGSRWVVPARLHGPIRQQAVLLNRGADKAAARAFLAFLKTPVAGAIITEYGYLVE